jgi:hypothetical protein
LSPRDRQILALTRDKLRGSHAPFGEAARALLEATEELIPAGRLYVLGATARAPVVGSIISGVGIAAIDDCVVLVRVVENAQLIQIGKLSP